MNKVFIGLILAVCVLGMALVMLNDRLGRKTDTRQAQQITHTSPLPRSPEEMAAAAKAMELAQAKTALEAPQIENHEPAPQPVAEKQPVRRSPARELPETKPARVPEPAPKQEAPKIREQKDVEVPRPKPEAVAEVKPAKPEPPQAEVAKPEPAAKPEPKQDADKAGTKTATRFVVYARDKGATVRIGGNAKVDYSSMTLEDPNRVVVDLAGEWKFPANTGVPKNELVSAVRVGKNGDKTRVVIDLKIKPRRVLLVPFKSGDGVDVRVDK